VHDNKLHVTVELLHDPQQPLPTQQLQWCAKATLLLPVALLERDNWRRSSAAALLFKQLVPCSTDLGARPDVRVVVCVCVCMEVLRFAH
jgi:hypothetical protein